MTCSVFPGGLFQQHDDFTTGGLRPENCPPESNRCRLPLTARGFKKRHGVRGLDTARTPRSRVFVHSRTSFLVGFLSVNPFARSSSFLRSIGHDDHLRRSDQEPGFLNLREYVTADTGSLNKADSTVLLMVTHSNLQARFMEIRFDRYVSWRP